MKEEWKPVMGFDGRYEVSNKGRIKSFLRRKTGKILSPNANKFLYGHMSLTLAGENGPAYRYVHRLVLEAFVGAPGKGNQCRHLDGNPKNNDIRNLEWSTPKENQADRVKHGTHLRGTRQHLSKLEENDVKIILERLRKKDTLAAIAADYGVSSQNIHAIKTGRAWSWLTGLTKK